MSFELDLTQFQSASRTATNMQNTTNNAVFSLSILCRCFFFRFKRLPLQVIFFRVYDQKNVYFAQTDITDQIKLSAEKRIVLFLSSRKRDAVFCSWLVRQKKIRLIYFVRHRNKRTIKVL